MRILEDIRAISNTNSVARNLATIITSHTCHLTLLIRIGQSSSCVPLIGSPLRLLVEYLIRIVFSSDISCRARIGPGLLIMHGHDIVIGADVSIGKNCKIFNGVTIGNKDTGRSSFHAQPFIGNDVLIGTGAKVLGPITIGDCVKIGANAVVLTDVPNGAVAVGVPARIICCKQSCFTW